MVQHAKLLMVVVVVLVVATDRSSPAANSLEMVPTNARRETCNELV